MSNLNLITTMTVKDILKQNGINGYQFCSTKEKTYKDSDKKIVFIRFKGEIANTHQTSLVASKGVAEALATKENQKSRSEYMTSCDVTYNETEDFVGYGIIKPADVEVLDEVTLD